MSVLSIFFSTFLFFTEKNPFIYQVTTKGFDAHDFHFFQNNEKNSFKLLYFGLKLFF